MRQGKFPVRQCVTAGGLTLAMLVWLDWCARDSYRMLAVNEELEGALTDAVGLLARGNGAIASDSVGVAAAALMPATAGAPVDASCGRYAIRTKITLSKARGVLSAASAPWRQQEAYLRTAVPFALFGALVFSWAAFSRSLRTGSPGEPDDAPESVRTRARDAALATVQLKSALLSSMSYAVRTPVSVILGYASIISERMRESGDESLRTYVGAIDRAGLRLIEIVEDLTGLSRLESGDLPIERRPLRLAPLVEAVARDFEPVARAKRLAFECSIDAPDIVVDADERFVLRALAKLVDNAIRFTESGKVSIRLYRTHAVGPCIDVRDTGIGIGPAFYPRLFERFAREDAGPAGIEQGSGLGLALARAYLERNDARILVDSGKGRGSVFTILFAETLAETPRGPDHQVPQGMHAI